MGQKVNAHGFRVGVVKPWDAKWYAEKDYATLLKEDVRIREFLKKQLYIKMLMIILMIKLKYGVVNFLLYGNSLDNHSGIEVVSLMNKLNII